MGRRTPGRGTNLALLALLAIALATGGLGFGLGGGWVRGVLVVHGAVGIGVVLLAPWKRVIARRGLARRRPGRTASVTLAALAVLVVLSGLAHSTGLLIEVGAVTAMQVHVAAALASVPFAVHHLLARPVRPRGTDLSRRTLLRAGALAGGVGLVYVATEGLVRALDLPGAERRASGSHERGSFDPAAMPVTQWLDDPVPRIEAGSWRLLVADGGGERLLGLDDLAAFRDRTRALLDCTGGWYAWQDWEGVRVDRLIEPAGARSIVVRSATGYARRFPSADAGRLLLATLVGGVPLAAGHGAPARLVAPGRRGFWWVKWVTEIRADPIPWWWQPPFPLT